MTRFGPRFTQPAQEIPATVSGRDGPPLTFGAGIHFCPGIWLAKMALRLALEGLLDAMQEYTVDRDALPPVRQAPG